MKSLTITFQACSAPYDNYVAQLRQSTGDLVSLTKFPQTQLLQWYSVANDGIGDSAFLTGIAPGSDNSLAWLVTQSAQTATAVSVPLCQYNLVFDHTWTIKVVSQSIYPAFGKMATYSSSGHEAVVVLHNPGVFNGFLILASWDKPCTSNIDVIWGLSNNANAVVTVREMQLYYDQIILSTGIKLLVSVSGALYLLTDIVNDPTKGWHYPEFLQLTRSFSTVYQMLIFPQFLCFRINKVRQFSLAHRVTIGLELQMGLC